MHKGQCFSVPFHWHISRLYSVLWSETFSGLPFIILVLHPKPENYWFDREQSFLYCTISSAVYWNFPTLNYAIIDKVVNRSTAVQSSESYSCQLLIPTSIISLNPDFFGDRYLFLPLEHPKPGQITITRV